MAEYIKKTELIDYIDEGKYRSKYELCFCENDVVNMINRMQTIDIVHCKDCKHYNYGDCVAMKFRARDEDFFCSDGERKDSNE